MRKSTHIRRLDTFRHGVLLAVLLCASASVSPGATAAYPFERYKVILDRKPFGDVPPAPVIVKPPPAPAPTEPGPGSYLKQVRMCAIREMGGEGGPLRVGLVDSNVKPPRSYFLYVGDMRDGIEVKDADYNEKKVLVRREEEEFWIPMNTGTAAAPPPTASRASNSRTTVARAAARAKPQKRRSYAERLRERRKAEELRRQVVAEEKAKLTKEELRNFFRQQQMEIIRKGQPPLPIPLTQEMDDQLVSEGVLPPVE